MIKIKYTDEAKLDIQNTYDYIRDVLCQAKAAKDIVNSIKTAINDLVYMPERYMIYDEEPWRSRELHHFNVKTYKIFYVYDKDNNMVKIIRIMYQSMNYSKQLKSSEHYFVSDNNLEEKYNNELKANEVAKSLGMTVEQLDQELEKGYQDFLNSRGIDAKEAYKRRMEKYNKSEGLKK